MLNILLVEDEAEKRRLILKALYGVSGISPDQVDVESDVYGAKKRLEERRYGLLILDINIPARADQATKEDAGLKVLHYANTSAKANPPGCVIGLTAYETSYDEAVKEFSRSIWKVIKFSYESDAWESNLKTAVRQLVKSDKPPFVNDGVTYHFDAAIVCALEEELNEVLALGKDWSTSPVGHDSQTYHTKLLNIGHRKIRVVATSLRHMGLPTAAVVATKLISTFRPRILIMSGICAGVKSKTELGDILIADPCFDWGSGKWVVEPESQELRFKPAAYQWRLAPAVRKIADDVANQQDSIQSIHEGFTGTKPESPPAVHIEAMASGGSVLQASVLMDNVREQHKNLVGVEMESYAVFTAAELSAEPRPHCVSIKSVCDFGDTEKSDSYHEFACYASAQASLFFLQRYFAT